MQNPTDRLSAPIVTRDELLREIEQERKQERTIALANGCFDLLHVGHIRFLQGAAREGDVLVVGINSDSSVRKLKGEGRPFVDEQERAELIASIRGVDYVTIFGEETAEALIRAVRPDVHCKGTDYTPASVPEAKIVAEYGGRVAIVGDPKDHSSTEVIDRVRKSH